jgi:hypothetical protein
MQNSSFTFWFSGFWFQKKISLPDIQFPLSETEVGITKIFMGSHFQRLYTLFSCLYLTTTSAAQGTEIEIFHSVLGTAISACGSMKQACSEAKTLM